MTHIGLFEGIGGFSLAARWMGWETKAWCEWNKFGQRVLRYHFPKAEGFGDITKSDFTKYEATIDILTGGFPCQPFSLAGEQGGGSDDRYLFPEMLRAIREIKPRWVVAENVYGITSPKFKEVFKEIYSSLEAEGYEVMAYIIPASAVDAPHKRERVWFIAYACGDGQQGGKQGLCKAFEQGYDEKDLPSSGIWRSEWRNGLPTPRIFRDDDGLSERLVGITIPSWRNESIKAFGNAIVPQVALQIFRVIEEMEQDRIKGAWAKTKNNGTAA